jgi:probable HAF family extracellular repeat protein
MVPIRHKLSLATLALALTAAVSAAAAPIEYAVVDLGTLPGGTRSSGIALGYGLSAVGGSTNSSGHIEAFYWHAGTMFGLGSLPGYDNSTAEGVTEFGPYLPVTVGFCYNVLTADTGRAFVNVFGWMFDLGSLGGPASRAHAIAGQGFIVGESVPGQAPGVWHAFRTNPYSFINPFTDDLGTLPGAESSFATAVNNRAQVTGNSGGRSYRTAPFGVITPSDELGSLGGSFSIGFGINDRGVVAGLSNTSVISLVSGRPIDHAFLFDTSMHDLGTIPGYENSVAIAINNAGVVVGYAANPPVVDPHATVWDPVRGMRDLNKLISPRVNWVLQVAKAINYRGEITGWGLHNGQLRGFLLRPIAGP